MADSAAYFRLMGFLAASITAGFALKRLANTLRPRPAAAGADGPSKPKAGIAQKLSGFAGFQILILTLAYWSGWGLGAFLLLLFVLSTMEILALRGPAFRPLPAYGILALFALAIAGYLAAGPFEPASGAPWLAFLFLLVAIFDGYSQIWGEILGGPRIAPRVSPGKTWSGFLGGSACCAAAAALGCRLILSVPPARPILLGLAVGMLAFAGDISASWVKRRMGIKDFSNALGPQGGVLDRADSLLWLGPAYFLAARLLLFPGY